MTGGPVSFSKTISLGNLLSLGGMIVMATIFIVTIRSAGQLENAELRAEMRVYSTRLQQIQDDFSRYKQESALYNTEIKQTIGNMSQQVTDLRISLAGEKQQRK